jgi:predicted nucleotide-binding protein (sugar kinase/HSP70/actin superfamily)
MLSIGREALRTVEKDPDKFAVVLFARPYNGFVEEAHMGIPNKFASRGIMVLPIDFIDLRNESAKHHMYWGMGQMILKAARFVKRHPQLFGTYVTNFSCGPDSFVITYFRDIMGRKPSLTLELDSHTADAGLETRVEAFLDIVSAYRQLVSARHIPSLASDFRPAKALLNGERPEVVTSTGEKLPMSDRRVTVLVPSMGRYGSQAFAALLKGCGMNAVAHRESDEAILKLGRANTSCKECLPLILTTGTLLSYIQNGKRPDEVLVYFMPTGSGPCRFGQYSIFMEDLIRRLEIPDVAMFALTAENSYLGMGKDFERRGWWAVVVSDVIEDIRAMLLANAADTRSAMKTFESEWENILVALEKGDFRKLENQLQQSAASLGRIPQKRPPETVPVITLAGEIFVRRDALSRQFLTEELARRGFATVCSPVAEWVKYCNWVIDEGLNDTEVPIFHKFKLKLRNLFQNRYERRIKSILAGSNLVHSTPVEVDTLIKNAGKHLSPHLQGEAILTVGGSMTEIVSVSCGVIAIGPFGCMPNRLSEAILNETMTAREKLATESADGTLASILTEIEELPFLAIESDGSPFPQVITAKLETFCLRAERLHERMLAARATH